MKNEINSDRVNGVIPFPYELQHKSIRVGPCCRATTIRGGAAAPPYRRQFQVGLAVPSEPSWPDTRTPESCPSCHYLTPFAAR